MCAAGNQGGFCSCLPAFLANATSIFVEGVYGECSLLRSVPLFDPASVGLLYERSATTHTTTTATQDQTTPEEEKLHFTAMTWAAPVIALQRKGRKPCSSSRMETLGGTACCRAAALRYSSIALFCRLFPHMNSQQRPAAGKICRFTTNLCGKIWQH